MKRRLLQPRELPSYLLGSAIVALMTEIAALRRSDPGSEKLEPLLRRLAHLRAARRTPPGHA